MDHKQWLEELVSADTAQNWEQLKALAERRLAIAPGDLNAIFALKKANLALNPELLQAYRAERESIEEGFAQSYYRYPEDEYTVIVPVQETVNPPRGAPNLRRYLWGGLVFICFISYLSVGSLFTHLASDNSDYQVVATTPPTPTSTLTGIEGTMAVIGRDERRTRRAEWAHPTLTAVAKLKTDLLATSSFGIGGYDSNQCTVHDQSKRIAINKLVDNPYVYVAMPLDSSIYGKKLVHTLLNPNGDLIYQKTMAPSREEISQNCFARSMYLAPNILLGVYRMRVTLDGELIFWGNITVEPNASPDLKTSISENTSIGFYGYLSDQCSVRDQRARIRISEISNNPYGYLAIPMDDSLYGKQLTYRWSNPDGYQVYQKTLELSQENIRRNCFIASTYLTHNMLLGVYRVSVKLDGDLVYEGEITVD